MKKLFILSLLLLATAISFSQTQNSYTTVTITTDTTGIISAKGFLPFTSAYGTFLYDITVDSTGADEGSTDSLAVYYKMLVNLAGNYYNKHDNYLLAKIGVISSGAITWANWINWEDNTKYLVEFPDLNVCDACSVYYSFGVSDSLITSGVIGGNFGKTR